MTDYERFDGPDGPSKPELVNDSAEIKPSETQNVNAAGTIEDTQIEVDKDANKSGLTIYDIEEGRGDVEYIDDPSKAMVPQTLLEKLQFQVQSVVEHLGFRLATMLLILLDFTLVIIDLSLYRCSGNNGIEITSHILISYFVLEIFMRMFYMEKRFFQNWVDILDMVVVFGSFILDLIFVFISNGNKCDSTHGMDYANSPVLDEKSSRLVVIGRAFRIVRGVRILYYFVTQRRHVSKATRKVVSQNKRRYQTDGFDLDLCYITERVIAMSFPSVGLMAVYRNPIREVARFFDTKHKDHYRLYNLCSERDYDETLFHNRVERIFIDDHNVPTVKDMLWFADNARKFMSESRYNVIALHCKGGKGRTGTMICVWLIEAGIFEDAKDSLDYFGDRRTDLSVGSKFQGVETPSQSRFVGYFEKVKKMYNGELPPRKELRITTFKIDSIAGVGHGDGSDFTVELRVDNMLIFECRVAEGANCSCEHDKENDSITITLKNAPVLADDVKVRFISSTNNFPKIYDHCAFYFWFHTTFIEDNKLQLVREEIDNPHKKAGKKVFRETFAIEVNFEDAESES